MIERVLLIFWALWLLLVLLAAFRVFAFSFARRRQDRRWGDGSKDQKPAVVIVAVKGFDLQSSPRFFDTLFDQDYSNYRVVVAFESWQDPVAIWLKDELELSASDPVWHHPEQDSSLKNITLVCAGTSEREGQKVHNQRAAFDHLSDADEVVAFVDADIVFKSDWLTRLVAPINQRTHPLTTTYRWLIPKRPTLPNQLASVINGSITTQGGWESTNVLWGGSMAIARSVFNELDVPNLLKGSLNDDLRLSKAARAAGNRIAFIRSLIVPTMIDFNWASFFEFAKRQYTQVKFFSPILYTGANAVLGFYALGILSIIAALVYGYFFAWVPLAAAYVIDQFRSLARQQIYLSLFPENGIQRKLFSASWLEHMLTPFWMLLHWLLLISTWTQSKITWAGISYRIVAKDKTRILHRPVSAERLPVGVPGLALIAALNDRKRGSYTQPIRPIITEPIEPVTATLQPAEEISISGSETVPMPDATTTADQLAEQADIVIEKNDVEPVAGESPASDPAQTAAAPAAPVSHPGVSAFVTPLTGLALPPTRTRPPAKAASSHRKHPAPRRFGKTAPAPREQLARHLMPVNFYPTNADLAESAPPAGTGTTVTPGDGAAPSATNASSALSSSPAPDALPPLAFTVVSHPGVSAFVTPMTALALPPVRRPSRSKTDPGNRAHPAPPRRQKNRSLRRETVDRHLMPVTFYPTNPALAESSSPAACPSPPHRANPVPEVNSPLETPSHTGPLPSPSLPPRGCPLPVESVAAQRRTFPRSRRVGVVGRRSATSSRVNGTGTPFVAGRIIRPVCRGAAGRPV